jgi:hypothetical protein
MNNALVFFYGASAFTCSYGPYGLNLVIEYIYIYILFFVSHRIVILVNYNKGKKNAKISKE